MDYLDNQEERGVDAPPIFNGAQCHVCIDVPAIVAAASTDWQLKWAKNHSIQSLSDSDFVDAILKALDDKIARCPAGSTIKIQFLYHNGGGYVPIQPVPTGKRRLLHPDCVAEVLRRIASRVPHPPIRKIYLAACCSQDHKNVVDRAFGVPGVTHVVTVNSTIGLACGFIEGHSWDEEGWQPTFDPAPFKVIVWTKEGNKQVAHVPQRDVEKTERFNVITNSIEDKSVPPGTGCPSFAELNGTATRRVAYYDSTAAAIAAANAIAPYDADVEAGLAMNAYHCPNMACQHKTLGPVTVSMASTTSHRFSLIALAASLFTLSWQFEGRVTYSWKATVSCH